MYLCNTYYNVLMAIPSTATPVDGRNDKGKKVKINSVSGALKNATGTVVFGPYTFNYKRNREEKGVKKRGPIITTSPYWKVMVDGYKMEMSFVKEELTFY